MFKVFIENKVFQEHIKYSLDTMFCCANIYNHEYEENMLDQDIKIYYGKCKPVNFDGIFIIEGELFSKLYLKPGSLPALPLKKYSGVPIFYMGDDSCVAEVKRGSSGIEINFDIIQGAFFLLSGYEEILNKNELRDLHGRYLVKERIIYQSGAIFTPVVNEYATMLRSWLIETGCNVPEKRNICYAHISHDVDLPYSLYEYRFKNFIKEKFRVDCSCKIDKACQYILNTEKRYDIRSSWYFKSGCHNNAFDLEYDLKEKNIQEYIQTLKGIGHEVGWHYSYDAAMDSKLFHEEIEKFKEINEVDKVYGRSHYLRYSIPESWRLYDKNGILYDASLGSAQCEGYVYGICIPFQLFDAEKGIRLKVWEIPLIIMDGTLRGKNYRGVTRKEAIEIIKKHVNIAKKYDGCFSLLWHNGSLNTLYWVLWKKVYSESMRMIAQECTCAIGNEIIAAYK